MLQPILELSLALTLAMPCPAGIRENSCTGLTGLQDKTVAMSWPLLMSICLLQVCKTFFVTVQQNMNHG